MICFQDTHVNFKCCDANALEDANANFKCYDANANFNIMMQMLLKMQMQI